MTQEEITLAEKWRSLRSKSALNIMMPIYDKYNGTDHSNECWCSSRMRAKCADMFNLWYNEQTKSNINE